MRTVYKYALPDIRPVDGFIVTLPAGAQILDFAVQGQTPMLWALVDSEETAREHRLFLLLGTGWVVPDDATHIGTIHTPPYVWHLFESRDPDMDQ